MLRNFKKDGYNIHIFYLWIRSADLAVARIADRVRKGGHSVPEGTVRRRFGKSLFNFTYYYRALADTWHLFDNSSEKPRAIAEYDGQLRVFDSGLYEQLCMDGE